MWKRRRMMRRKRIIEKGEEMKGKRRDEEDMQDSLVVEEGMMFNFPLVPLPLVFFPAASVTRFFLPRRS